MTARKLVNANVLVTGADGFLGSKAVASLLASGAHVKALDYARRGRLEGIKNVNLELVGSGTRGILDSEVLGEALKGIDVVYHFAIDWSGHLWQDTETLGEFLRVNLKGTLNLLEASKFVGIKQFIYASSAVIYGIQRARVVDEETVCMPETWNRDPGPAYPIMKLTTEKLCHICAKQFGFALTTFRLGVVFDERKAILPDPAFVKQILKDENIEVQRGVGRTSIHVDDVIQAFNLATLNPKAYNQIFNLSNPATFITDQKMYQLLIDAAHSKSKIVALPKPTKSPAIESMRKTERVLKWNATKNLGVLKLALMKTIPRTVST